MTMVYLVLITIISCVSIHVTKKYINAITIYNVVWGLMLILYNLKLIQYKDITITTWCVIIFTDFILALGYILGTKSVYSKSSAKCDYNKWQEEMDAQKLKECIYKLIFISLLGIIPNTYFLIQRYGINLIDQTALIYTDNVIRHQGVKTIPYLGTASQAAVILGGIYLYKYGVHWSMFVAVILSILSGIGSGSRGYLLWNTLFFILPSFLLGKNIFKVIERYKKPLFLISIIILTVFYILNKNRSINITHQTYYSTFLNSMVTSNPGFVKNYVYFTSPIAVLNEYLENPDFDWGMNTFQPVLNLLNRLGANIKVSRYQKAYYVPMKTNVGTWLREIIQDFGFIGMALTIFIFGFILGYLDKLGKSSNSLYKPRSVYMIYSITILYSMLIMSFYVWYFREGFIYVLILLYFLIKKWTHGKTI